MTNSKPAMFPDIHFIMFDILLRIIDLEFEYASTRNVEILKQVEYHNWLLEYWEQKSYELYGGYAFDPFMFIR